MTDHHNDHDRGPGETVGEVVYNRIRNDILFGELAPGERLRLDNASRRYGASVGTIRELLNRLSSEGLVVAEGQRGFEVAPASPTEFREVAALRLLLESHAMSLSFAAGDLDWEARVVAAHHKLSVLEHRMLKGTDVDLALLRQCDSDFHRAMISACGSRVLMETYGQVHDRYLRYLTIAVTFRGDVSVKEHAKLLDCALSRDAARASAILEVHINSCLDMALDGTVPSWAAGPGRAGAAKAAGQPAADVPRRRASRKAAMTDV